jgi:uncharacterized membrane protein YebE (DUF533 family)
MLTYKEKLSILDEMIALSQIDGKVHEREYQFIQMIAEEFQVREEDFKELFHVEAPKIVLKNEFQRIEQFYRLALLMHSDHHKLEEEVSFLKNVAINLGLNPMAVKKVLLAMDESPTKMLDPKHLLELFRDQLN